MDSRSVRPRRRLDHARTRHPRTEFHAAAREDVGGDGRTRAQQVPQEEGHDGVHATRLRAARAVKPAKAAGDPVSEVLRPARRRLLARPDRRRFRLHVHARRERLPEPLPAPGDQRGGHLAHDDDLRRSAPGVGRVPDGPREDLAGALRGFRVQPVGLRGRALQEARIRGKRAGLEARGGQRARRERLLRDVLLRKPDPPQRRRRERQGRRASGSEDEHPVGTDDDRRGRGRKNRRRRSPHRRGRRAVHPRGRAQGSPRVPETAPRQQGPVVP
mmetsp:Transcript_20741/g.49006  ORF Transcript_20741/g.49006 Transcript_20741/m.49006 type:complete len:273 (+) Transcript_20741:1027-1845(+)